MEITKELLQTIYDRAVQVSLAILKEQEYKRYLELKKKFEL